MTINIRDAVHADLDVIADFNARMALETEGSRLEPAVIGAGVEALLADRGKGRYWVAAAGQQVVGQIMVTYEWSDWRNGTLWWIQSVYVHEDFRRQGVFSMLYRHVESLASAAPRVAGIRLYVDAGNKRAQATYEKLGMKSSGYRVMQALF